MAKKWKLEAAYPPMRMVEFRPLEQRVIAEWMMAAKVTCDESYHLSAIADRVRTFVMEELKAHAKPNRLDFDNLVKEEKQ